MRPTLLGVLGLGWTSVAAVAGPTAGPVPLGDDQLGCAAAGAAQLAPVTLPAGLPAQVAVAAQPYLDRANAVVAQANGLLAQADALLATLRATPPAAP